MRDFLPHLHRGAPGVVGVGFSTVGTLVVRDDVLDLEGLLQDRAFADFLLDCYFDLDAAGVWLRPDEAGVDDAGFG